MDRRRCDRRSGGGLAWGTELLVPLFLPLRSAHGTGIAGRPLRIRRDATLCIDCGKCERACPSALPVDRLVSIRSAECIGCLQCVAACPAEGALFLSAPRRRRVPAWSMAAGVAALFLGAYAYARSTGHWDTDLPDRIYTQLVPHADEFEHP